MMSGSTGIYGVVSDKDASTTIIEMPGVVGELKVHSGISSFFKRAVKSLTVKKDDGAFIARYSVKDAPKLDEATAIKRVEAWSKVYAPQ